MKTDTSELEQTYFQPARKNADRTIGYILIAMMVLFMFSVYVMGMQRVQSVSDRTFADHPRDAETTITSEIGNSADPVNANKE